MPNPIETTGTNNDSVATTHESGESVRSWVTRHLDNVDFASSSNAALETSWTADDGPHEVKTTRKPGESDAEFVARHENEMLLEMLESNPIP